MCRYNWMPKNDIWGRRHPPFHEKKKRLFLFVIAMPFPSRKHIFQKNLSYFCLQRKLSENLSKFKSFWSCETPLTNFYMHTQTHTCSCEKSRVEIQIKVFFFMELMGNHFSSKCMVIKMASGLRGWWRRGYFAYNLLALSNIVQTASRQTTCFLKLFLSYLCILPMPTKHFFQTVVIFY